MTTNVIPLPRKEQDSDPRHPLTNRFGVTPEQLHKALVPLFLLMHDHGITNVSVARDHLKALITIDGQTL